MKSFTEFHNEEVEQIDEVSKKSLKRYISKATDDKKSAYAHDYRYHDSSDEEPSRDHDQDSKDYDRAEKREKGIDLARAKVNKSGKSGRAIAKVKANEEVALDEAKGLESALRKLVPGYGSRQALERNSAHWEVVNTLSRTKSEPEDKVRAKSLRHFRAAQKYSNILFKQRALPEEADKGLAAKAEKSGVSLGTLKKVYKRGVAAWNSGHRPGTTPQQWGMARVNSYITKGKGTYHGADKDLREEKLDRVAKDKESGLPKKYVAGLSSSTAKARASHWEKMSKLSDRDPAAYEPAPGDATSKTKESKHTKKYRDMYGEACWSGYKRVGSKKKGNKMVPNCVPEEVEHSLEEGNAENKQLRRAVDRKVGQTWMKRDSFSDVERKTTSPLKMGRGVNRFAKSETYKTLAKGQQVEEEMITFKEHTSEQIDEAIEGMTKKQHAEKSRQLKAEIEKHQKAYFEQLSKAHAIRDKLDAAKEAHKKHRELDPKVKAKNAEREADGWKHYIEPGRGREPTPSGGMGAR